MHFWTTAPTEKSTELARDALRALAPTSQLGSAAAVTLRADDGTHTATVAVPREVFEMLVAILGQMAIGSAVTLVPTQAELTTQEAADLIGVSRPFLVSLLDAGKIPHRLVGTHRRVRAADLLAYKALRYAEQREAADELTRDAQELGLGY
jgi:excisionase family DNA binding protein